MNQSAPPSRRVAELSREVAELQETLRAMEEHRDRLIRRRRRQVLTFGVGLSLVVHLGIMFYLTTLHRQGPGRRPPAPASFEFAILQDEELTELASRELDDLLPEVVSDLDDLPDADPSAELEPAVPSAELEVAGAGSMPALGGAGDGTGVGGTLGGGGAGTTFFGVSSRGMRFAFIVDRSGSMGQGRKMLVAIRELERSISLLPDYAYFYVVLFSTTVVEPPMNQSWLRARKSTVTRLVRWLYELDPDGGTQPIPAFHRVFGLDVRPDVIFFLTDGEIPADTPDLVADLNSRGPRVVINTIAFGDAGGHDLLERIADESGGVFRDVPAEGP